MLDHLIHAGHVARHGGVFTFIFAILGGLAAAPLRQEDAFAFGVHYSISKNLLGNTAESPEAWIAWILVGMAFGAAIGFGIGKAVVGLGWMKEEDIRLED